MDLSHLSASSAFYYYYTYSIQWLLFEVSRQRQSKGNARLRFKQGEKKKREIVKKKKTIILESRERVGNRKKTPWHRWTICKKQQLTPRHIWIVFKGHFFFLLNSSSSFCYFLVKEMYFFLSSSRGGKCCVVSRRRHAQLGLSHLTVRTRVAAQVPFILTPTRILLFFTIF